MQKSKIESKMFSGQASSITSRQTASRRQPNGDSPPPPDGSKREVSLFRTSVKCPHRAVSFKSATVDSASTREIDAPQHADNLAHSTFSM